MTEWTQTAENTAADPGALGGACFDCDGVILDSNRIKAQAFRDILAGEPPDLVEAFVKHRAAHPGLSRDALFRFFFRDLVRTDDWASLAEHATLAFVDRTLDALTTCPLVPGIERALAALAEQGVPCAVVSAAARADLETVLNRRRLRQFFRDVRGGDRSKADNVTTLLDAGRLTRPLVFFGDSIADMEAAETIGCHFVFVSGVSEWTDGLRVCTLRDHDAITDFTDPRLWTMSGGDGA